jgi:hypothetical protein
MHIRVGGVGGAPVEDVKSETFALPDACDSACFSFSACCRPAFARALAARAAAFLAAVSRSMSARISAMYLVLKKFGSEKNLLKSTDSGNRAWSASGTFPAEYISS